MIPRTCRAPLVWAIAIATCAAAFMAGGCRRGEVDRKSPAGQPAAMTDTPASASCASCHAEIFKRWSESHHALAHRALDPAADAEAFTPERKITLGETRYRVGGDDGRPTITETPSSGAIETYVASFVLGHTPLRQYVVPVGGGRYQATELAFDPAAKEWFGVFGAESRRRGEWGHWRGRGMNWNSMCAHCHLTGFEKNYDATTDTYASTWREHGIGCAQCHTLSADHATNPPARPRAAAAIVAARHAAQETCAPCHARNEALTGELRPGNRYDDHFRLTLPVDPAVFYPDGQMRDEVFNHTSLLLSRMGGKAGVSCLDCHDPHSGKTTLPAANNALCLQCHGPTPRQNAPAIDPVAHSHHAPGSAGNRCIECHMPRTTTMQRDPRHDHSFSKPDPLLTRELGIPNACNRCHTDRTVDWAVAQTDLWYGSKMESRQRGRPRVIAAVQAGAADGAERLLSLLDTEDVPAWRATLLQLARSYAADPRVRAAAEAAIREREPLVRAAAAHVLAAAPGEPPQALRPLLDDPVRLVRLEAAWRLSPELPAGSKARAELDAYLAVSADQPAGQLRIGQDLFNRGRNAEAETAFRKATVWDPNSSAAHQSLGLALSAQGRASEAAAALWRAAQLSPTDGAAAFQAALAFSAANRPADAELALREAARRDPRHHRAWYNLGLLLAQTGRAAAAVEALQQAEQLAPTTADYPYALATVLWQQGEREAAADAARRTLRIDPAHRSATELLRAAAR